jgi:Tfp pilus assembly protein FimT
VVGEQEHLKLFPNSMKKNNLQKGISLAETIIYVAIFSIFVIGLAQFSTTLSNTRLHTQGVLEVNDQGSQAIKLITQTLRNGSSINSPTIGNSGSSLSIDTGVGATNPTVFSEIGGVLYINEGGGGNVALTNNKVVVSNLTFSNFSRTSTPNIIKISFTITSTNARDPYSVNFDGSGALRK